MRVEVFNGDVSQIEPIARRWYEECNKGWLDIEIDLSRHLIELQSLIDDDDKDLLVLWSDEPVGYMGIILFLNPMSSQLCANEHYWYIVPEKRGTGAIRLLSAAEQWAREHKCQYLLASASKLASNLHDRVCELYRKLGYEHFETTYIKRVI